MGLYGIGIYGNFGEDGLNIESVYTHTEPETTSEDMEDAYKQELVKNEIMKELKKTEVYKSNDVIQEIEGIIEDVKTKAKSVCE